MNEEIIEERTVVSKTAKVIVVVSMFAAALSYLLFPGAQIAAFLSVLTAVLYYKSLGRLRLIVLIAAIVCLLISLSPLLGMMV